MLAEFPKTGQITANFNVREFACKGKNCCGGASPINFWLVENIQRLRDAVSKKLGKSTPLKINSGFRCIKHNAAVGGAKQSLHTLGLAADVALPKGLTITEFEALAKTLNFPKIIRYSWGLHLDIRAW